MKKHTNFDDEMEKFPQTPDWPLIIGTAFMIAFGIVALIAIL